MTLVRWLGVFYQLKLVKSVVKGVEEDVWVNLELMLELMGLGLGCGHGLIEIYYVWGWVSFNLIIEVRARFRCIR